MWIQPLAKYIDEALYAWGLTDCRPSNSPKLEKPHMDGDDEDYDNPSLFRTVTCKLLYPASPPRGDRGPASAERPGEWASPAAGGLRKTLAVEAETSLVSGPEGAGDPEEEELLNFSEEAEVAKTVAPPWPMVEETDIVP